MEHLRFFDLVWDAISLADLALGKRSGTKAAANLDTSGLHYCANRPRFYFELDFAAFGLGNASLDRYCRALRAAGSLGANQIAVNLAANGVSYSDSLLGNDEWGGVSIQAPAEFHLVLLGTARATACKR